MVVKTVAAAKRIRQLLQNQPERQKRQEARVELRKKIRDDGIALTERMDHERTLNLRADTPLTARATADMGARPAADMGARAPGPAPGAHTHLTLPTICRVELSGGAVTRTSPCE